MSGGCTDAQAPDSSDTDLVDCGKLQAAAQNRQSRRPFCGVTRIREGYRHMLGSSYAHGSSRSVDTLPDVDIFGHRQDRT